MLTNKTFKERMRIRPVVYLILYLHPVMHEIAFEELNLLGGETYFTI